MKKQILSLLLAAAFLLAALSTCSLAGNQDRDTWTTAVTPKPLSDQAKKGLEWLAEHQSNNGGWSQGEESQNMGAGMDKIKGIPNVADTCIATLALIRSGSTPSKGQYAQNILKAVDFICSEIEKSDDKSLYITDVKGTRVQTKLGPYIDTFMAPLVLTEIKGKMPDEKGNTRVIKALKKTMAKIEMNQKDDGTWDGQGWAPTLSQAMAGKAINRATQAGVEVNEKVRARTETYARSQYDGKSKAFKKEGSAGVDLYSSASNLGQMNDSDVTNNTKIADTQQQLKKATSETERKDLQGRLDRYQQNKNDLESARKAVVEKMENKDFVSGFGSNGGEEFLSYLNIGESLVQKGGADWEKWSKSMGANMDRIQNKDGSWTGHHCITGRTFCTAAALLVLMVDRTPVPVASKMKRQ
ncbi:MAG: hypothetical protein AB9903_00290 [Vulcanimicrobiota bacterium]